MTESFNRKLGRLAQNVSGTGSITTNASTASAWQTARTITLGGDLSGSVSLDGSSNVSLTATVSGDSIVLGTDTTGNYVATVTAGSGITVSGSGTETASVTVSIDNTVATLTGSQTLTNKTISGADNTLSNIGNASLTNSSITINGTSTSLGGTRTLVTDDIAEDASPTNLWYTDARTRAAISVTDAGGDGSLSYVSGTGVITYTGPSATEVRAHFSAGTGVTITTGQIAIGQAVATTDNVTFAGVTADNVRVGVTAAGEIDTSAGNLTLDSTGGTTVMDDDVNVTGNLQIDGNLTVSGTTVTINATNLAVEDNMIYLNSGSTVTHPDLGFAGNYNDGTYRHAGLFRDESDGRWKFFHQYTPEPDASAYIDITHASFALAPVQASSFIGNLTGNASTVTNGVYTTDTGTVTNTMLAGSIANNKLANSTISGISLGSNLAALTIGTGLSGTSYNGSSAVTIAIDSTVATLTGSQTLTNKTLTAPIISTMGGDEGGEIVFGLAATNTTLSGNVITDVYLNRFRIFESGGTSRGVYIDLTTAAAGAASSIWHSGNDGAGSGLDADLLDGYNSATAATANTIVLRDSGADITGRYFFGVHFNQSSSNSENPTIAAFWTNSSSDNYNRKSTPAHVISQLGLLTTSNYSSYAPSLTGTGASGTWGISITGTSASTDLINSVGVTGNLDSMYQARTFGWEPSTTGRPTDQYGQGIAVVSTGNTHNNTNNWITQLGFGTNMNTAYFRTKVNIGAWGAWRELLHSGNYTSYSPTLTGGNASGTWGISISGNAATAGALTSMNISQFTNNSGYITGLSFDGLSSKTGGTGTYTTSGDFRAPIFYDSNDTTYYVDPNTTATSIYVRGEIRNPSIWINDGDNYNDYNENIRLFNAPNGVSVIAFSASGTGGMPTTSILGYGSYMERRFNHSWQDRMYNGYVEAYGSYRAPIFYDSNNTGYYTDPASTSNLNALQTYSYQGNGNVGGTGAASWHPSGIYSGGTQWLYGDIYRNGAATYGGGAAYYTIVYDQNNSGYYCDPASTSQLSYVLANDWFRPQGSTGLYFQDYGYGLRSAHGEGNSYGNATTYGGGRNGWSGWGIGTRHVFMSTTGDNVGVHDNSRGWIWYWNGSYTEFPYGYTIHGGSSRSPIFYDQNDTGYYVDPNGTARLSYVAANAGIRIDGNEDLYLDYNYGCSIVGVYSSYRYQGVFSMGNSYKLARDGTTTGNLYGMAWSHPNAGGVAGNLNDHGLLVLTNGGWCASLTGSTRSRDDMRSPIFYDNNDTGYYIDPNSTSNSALRMRGGALFGPNISWGAYLYVGTNGRPDGTASVCATNGNLHIDCQNGYAMYLNYYSTNNIYTWGNMGIGSDSASYRLHVHGTGYATSDFRAPIFYDSNDTNWYCNPNSTSRFWTLNLENRLYIYGGNPGDPGSDVTPQVFFKTGGGLGLSSIETDFWTGFTGSSYPNNFQIGFRMAYDKRLYVWQDVVQYYSDERLKEKTGTLAGALDAIKAWTPFKYVDNALANSFNFGSGRTQIGLSAQEVQQYYPELVDLAPFDAQSDFSDETNPRRVSKSGENYLTLNYTRLVPVLVQAIKEQQAKIEELENRINNS